MAKKMGQGQVLAAPENEAGHNSGSEFAQACVLFGEMTLDHDKWEKGNKLAGRRFRAASVDLGKIMKGIRAEMLEREKEG